MHYNTPFPEKKKQKMFWREINPLSLNETRPASGSPQEKS